MTESRGIPAFAASDPPERAPAVQLSAWLDPGIAPSAVFHRDGADLEVFVVKRSTEPWPDSACARIAADCRRARTRIYGGCSPVLDGHDTKADVYLVRARYRAADDGGDGGDGAQCEEWMSVRLVPFSRAPTGLEELSLYRSRSRPDTSVCDLMVTAGLAPSAAALTRHAWAIGGVGALRPVTEHGRARAANAYSWQSVLAALRCFFDDDARADHRCDTLLFQIPPKLAHHYAELTMHRLEGVCGLPDDDFELDRRLPEGRALSYAVPGYFLWAPDVAALLQRFVAHGALHRDAIAALLPRGRTPDDFFAAPAFTDLRNFGALFGADGPLPAGSSLDGETLRAAADREVRGAPEMWQFRLDVLVPKARALEGSLAPRGLR